VAILKNHKTSLQFINHASVLVKHGDISLLCDPWYQGDAFNKGWRLIHELQDDQISSLLDSVTHLWISHEHPDHFSILFFKKFGHQLKQNKVRIIFQSTNDKRVENFFSKSNYNLTVIKFDSWLRLSKDVQVLCFKDGFYDSGLAIKTSDKTIINLNDCEVKDKSTCEAVLKNTGPCDILLTQFSYAAWKGGIDNVDWRKLAAKEKLDSMKLQASYFKPTVIIPFASYIYFSNNENFYLNDAANKPTDVINAFIGHHANVNVMKPFEIFDDLRSEIDNTNSIRFWEKEMEAIDQKDVKGFDLISLRQLEESFERYTSRIFSKNTRWFMKLLKRLPLVPAFNPVIVKIVDLNIKVNLDIFADSLQECTLDADISMSSESLNFILNNTFGFDTLTVNGCFEEIKKSGFSRAARTLAIENLNNMGIEFRPKVILNLSLITMFISRLWVVSKKLKLTKIV
tara:strand:- start:1518 stop:2885 length:1368 start_codon:yes stop_codon:yes gene_type:complete